MTSLIAWIGIDSRGPASFYLASDSRISWSSSEAWDFGRKVFASSRYPDILGYYGEVFFTSLVLGQIIDLIDAGNLFELDTSPEQKFESISGVFKQAHATYPEMQRRPFSVVHCSRRNEGMTTAFALFELRWNPSAGWQSQVVQLPSDKSGIADAYGSGTQIVLDAAARWRKSEVGGTSRSVFSAFCDALSSSVDPASGGAPQLVGVYRKGPAESFGVVYKNKRYLHGLCVDESPWLGGVEWRNEIFERCDWKTGRRLESAQRHARPSRLQP